MSTHNCSRRKFLKSGSAAVFAPWFIPATSLGFAGTIAPSERIVMAAIGCGGKGRDNTRRFLEDKRVQFVAVCDVDNNHLSQAADEVNKHNGNQDCAAFEDFRQLLQRGDIDAVHVSTPDHWHGIAAVGAMRLGKDVYCEKPLANSYGESMVIRDTARCTGRILQCGSHERSTHNCRLAAHLIQSQRFGKVQTVRIQMPCEQEHHLQARNQKTNPTPQPVPDHLNWDLWQGHTGPTNYAAERCHFWWRFILDYGGGEMTDRGAHIIDIAQLALGEDNSGPVEFAAKGMQTPGSLYDAFWDYEFTNTYANGVKLIGSTAGQRGLRFECTDGWLFVAIHGGQLTASNPELLPPEVREGKQLVVNEAIPEHLEIELGFSPGHHKNFIDCVINRSEPMASAEMGHRTATICHLNNIAMRVGRPLAWDPSREELINDIEAGKYLLPKMRRPWTI